MKAKDLRSMSQAELKSKLIELRKEMIKHNAQIATGTTPKSPGQIREIKKTIAKILTIGTSKLEEQKSSSVSTQKAEPKETTKPSDNKKVDKKETVPAKKSEEE